MRINIPHIHKIEGDAGFWARVTREGKVKELKLQALLGLRQIEGIVVGRRAKEVPIVVSRICGICPVVHILNGTCSLEKALGVRVSPQIVLLRKLLLSSQIIQSHALHLFFMALPDFLNIENDLQLLKKFPKEAKAALKIRDYALAITKTVGGRVVHPVTPRIGGFSKIPEKNQLKKPLKDYSLALKGALLLAEKLKEIDYPDFNRETIFASLFSKKEYPFYQSEIVKIGDEKLSVGDFYSNKINEDLKTPPVKKVRYKGKAYMLGAIARLKNNETLLNSQAKETLNSFLKKKKIKKEDFFKNIFHNLFCQAIEVVHFIVESRKLIDKILKEDFEKLPKDIKIREKEGAGLSAMEAPRGTLFDYFQVDKNGRIFNCNIITPSAQFLNNLEEDLKIFLPKVIKLSEKERTKKLRSLVRIYDPCISCATH